jgi:hypothetical protein
MSAFDGRPGHEQIGSGFFTTGPLIRVADPRLHFVLVDRPISYATVDELAAASGMATDDVLAHLQPFLHDGTLALEIHEDTLFLHTAPRGRTARPTRPVAPANLWERLRDRAPLERAAALWKLIRALEASGWRVETHLDSVCAGLGRLTINPYFGVEAGPTVVPVVCYPTAAALSGGVLESYEQAGAAGLAVTCDMGGLDAMVTAVRSWTARRGRTSSMIVIVLEAPRFNPTLVSTQDSSVSPVAVSRYELGQALS